MTAIERGARALALEQSGVDEWDALDEAFQERLKEQVRAVVKSIRDPNGAMVSAAVSTAEKVGPHDHVGIFAAMIDAALTE